MFGFKKRSAAKGKNDLGGILNALCKREISIKTCKAKKGGLPTRSKFGGNPTVPSGFEWPRFSAKNYDDEVANRPLSFLCQIDLSDVAALDKDNLLPKRGLLLFFYELESMAWGFDPTDLGCSRVYFFENTASLVSAPFPDDMADEYKIKEYDLKFSAADSYPNYEELEYHAKVDVDWEDYDNVLEKRGYAGDFERHKLLGYANIIQSEMLTECERTTRGLYCGNPESYASTPSDVKDDVEKKAAEWILLFQMASIEDDDFELMFGDVGNIYFYIKKQDLKDQNFDKAWLVLQCG